MGLHSTPSEVFSLDCSPWREVCLSWMLCLNSEMPLRGFSVPVVIYFVDVKTGLEWAFGVCGCAGSAVGVVLSCLPL